MRTKTTNSYVGTLTYSNGRSWLGERSQCLRDRPCSSRRSKPARQTCPRREPMLGAWLLPGSLITGMVALRSRSYIFGPDAIGKMTGNTTRTMVGGQGDDAMAGAAPVRFCDLGGWTDTRIVPRGAVLNFTARMYTYVTLTIQEGPSGVILESLDAEEQCSFHDMRQVEYNGVLDLLKAAVARSASRSGGMEPFRPIARSGCKFAPVRRRQADWAPRRRWGSRRSAPWCAIAEATCCRTRSPASLSCSRSRT